MDKEILPPDEAQWRGLQFIQSKYYNGKATIDDVNLVTEGAFPVYHLEGNIKMKERSLMGKLIYRQPPLTFKLQVHALDGSILSYELR